MALQALQDQCKLCDSFPTPLRSAKSTLLEPRKTSLSNSCANVNISGSMQIVWLTFHLLNWSPGCFRLETHSVDFGCSISESLRYIPGYIHSTIHPGFDCNLLKMSPSPPQSRTVRIDFLLQCIHVKVSRACPCILIQYFVPWNLESLNCASSYKVTTPNVSKPHVVRRESHII